MPSFDMVLQYSDQQLSTLKSMGLKWIALHDSRNKINVIGSNKKRLSDSVCCFADVFLLAAKALLLPIVLLQMAKDEKAQAKV